MKPDWQDERGRIQLYCENCLIVMPALAENSADAIITDPPYGLKFMGKNWDHGIPGEHFWKEALRVAKPGAYLLAFGGTRTFHRLTCAIEDAGWEIRDTVMYVYGSGFPKSHDVSKGIDKQAGMEREVIGKSDKQPAGFVRHGRTDEQVFNGTDENRLPATITAPATDAARQWQGWGTALKPAWEPIIVARKPLAGTVAENVLKYGTGAINVDGCRVATSEDQRRPSSGGENGLIGTSTFKIRERKVDEQIQHQGRWPANLIHDGSDEVLAGFPSGKVGARRAGQLRHVNEGDISFVQGRTTKDYPASEGSAARFFYCAKASKQDRDEGCEGMEERGNNRYGEYAGTNKHAPKTTEHNKSRNHHPTVKPTALMRYLCKLVTPPNGVILDPFLGSGSTLKAAVAEGFRGIGIEMESEYVKIATARIKNELLKQQQLLNL